MVIGPTNKAAVKFIKPRGRRNRQRLSWNSVASLAGLLVAAVALIVSAYQSWLAVEATEIARVGLTDQQTVGSWQILSNRSSGASGKQYALERLLELQSKVVGLKLDCEYVGGQWGIYSRTGQKWCNDGLDMRDLRAVGAGAQQLELGLIDAAGGDFTGALFQNVRIGGSDLSYADFENATFVDSQFVGVDFSGGDFIGAEFHRANATRLNFTNAFLQGTVLNFTDPIQALGVGDQSRTINISGARFCSPPYPCRTRVSKAFFQQSFYLEDEPPIGAEMLDGSELLVVCTAMPTTILGADTLCRGPDILDTNSHAAPVWSEDE